MKVRHQSYFQINVELVITMSFEVLGLKFEVSKIRDLKPIPTLVLR